MSRGRGRKYYKSNAFLKTTGNNIKGKQSIEKKSFCSEMATLMEVKTELTELLKEMKNEKLKDK